MQILPVLALFLVRLIAGYAVLLACFAPQVTRGPWVRVSLFVIAALALVAVAAQAPLPVCLMTAGAALLVERGRAFGLLPLSSVLYVLPGALWALYWMEMELGGAHGPQWIYPPLGLLAGLAVGGTLGAMLLGHGYLTARGLSFTPFRRMAVLLLAVLGLRTLSLLPVILDGSLVMGDWIFLSARAAFGLLMPLVFGWLAYRCIKIESNQSATGIYYAMVVLVGAGELIAAYLRIEEGIPA